MRFTKGFTIDVGNVQLELARAIITSQKDRGTFPRTDAANYMRYVDGLHAAHRERSQLMPQVLRSKVSLDTLAKPIKYAD